jgi:hypothetical protein
MLVTLWIKGGLRETRDADFLGHGDADSEHVRSVFEGIMSIEVDEGLTFDAGGIRVGPIRDNSEYSGIRLRTTAYLERIRIPVTIDIGFGDALSSEAERLDYPTLLDMEVPRIRTYPPATVLAEKFQAIVALGIINGRMKDYFDLWAVPQTRPITSEELDASGKPPSCAGGHRFRPSGLRDSRMRSPSTVPRRHNGKPMRGRSSSKVCPSR